MSPVHFRIILPFYLTQISFVSNLTLISPKPKSHPTISDFLVQRQIQEMN